jgi:NAD(P)-dependent dehydrogenase (short-subunit alcohol dehydrogenase family)
VATTVDRFGRLEVLVNNVAIAEYVDLDNIDLETVDKIFRVNIMAPLTLSSAAVKYMAAAGAGSIINVSGSTAFLARPNNAVYVASKAAMQSFTRSCAAKWADVGIRVNSLVPGLIDTEMSASVTPEQRAHALAIGILKREGRPDELTGGALYLASDASSYVTGQTLMVDGGMVLR